MSATIKTRWLFCLGSVCLKHIPRRFSSDSKHFFSVWLPQAEKKSWNQLFLPPICKQHPGGLHMSISDRRLECGKKKLESLFWQDFGVNPEFPQDSLCVSQLGYSLCVWGYSRGFSGGIRGYSGVFSGYSHPGAFQNHWFFHISALDLFRPSDSYIILKRKIKHLSHEEGSFSYEGECGTLRSHQPGLFA